MRRLTSVITAVALAIGLFAALSFTSVASASTVAEIRDCRALAGQYLLTHGPHLARLAVDALTPVQEDITDVGQGCLLVALLEFHSSGGSAVRRQLQATGPGSSVVTGYPEPPSPATVAGVDPYCKQKSYALDVLHLETWVVETFQFWDNYAPCCASLVNPYATQNATPDPFFVVTANSVTDAWVNPYWDVQGAGHAAFHSNGGPTDNGVDSWVRAQSDACQGNSSFFGPTTPGGSFGRDPVVGPVR